MVRDFIVNGWERLGVVLTGAIGLPLFAAEYAETTIYSFHQPSEFVLAMGPSFEIDADPEDMLPIPWTAVLDEAVQADPDLSECINGTINLKGFGPNTNTQITCERGQWGRFKKGMTALLLTGLAVFGLGHTIAWIRRGFRDRT